MKLLAEGLWIFVLFSFLGWTAHCVWQSVKEKRPLNVGFLTLPFMPTIGTGFVLLFVFLSRYENIFMLFFASALLLTLFKYFAARLFDRAFGFKWKTYADSKYKLNKYVSIWEPFAYGAAGVLAVRLAFVPVYWLASVLPLWAAVLIPAAVAVLIIADAVISCVTVVKLRKNLKQMADISKLLENSGEGVSDDALRGEYERKMIESSRFRLRLIRAFPDMESFDYEKQLANLQAHHNLVRERNNAVYEKRIERKEDRPFAYGLSFSKLFWLFVIGSFFGTVLETFWALFAEGHFEMRVGWVLGPFIPVYGVGAVAITLCLYKLHSKSDVIVYIASAVIGATFEYLCSYFQEKFLGTISWDYSDTPFNIDGRTNLMFALIWGFLGLVWLRNLYPFISNLIEKIPKKAGKIITVIFCIFMALDGLLSIAAINRWHERDDGIPPKTAVGQLCDAVFTDDYMEFIYPHMGNKDTFAEERRQKAEKAEKKRHMKEEEHRKAEQTTKPTAH